MYRISKCFWIIEIGDGVVKPSLCWQVVAIKLNSVGYRCLNKIYSIERYVVLFCMCIHSQKIFEWKRRLRIMSRYFEIGFVLPLLCLNRLCMYENRVDI